MSSADPLVLEGKEKIPRKWLLVQWGAPANPLEKGETCITVLDSTTVWPATPRTSLRHVACLALLLAWELFLAG